MPFQGLKSTRPQQNVNNIASVAQNSGFAKPLLMGYLGKATAQAETAQAGMNDQQAAWKAIETAMDMAETDPQSANAIIDAEAKANPAMQQFVDSGLRFAGRSKKPWHLLNNTKTGDIMWANIDEWIRDGQPMENGKIAEKYMKLLSRGEAKKKGGKTRTTKKKGGKTAYEIQNEDGTWSPDTSRGDGGEFDTYKESGTGKKGIAKVGHINQARKSLVNAFWNILPPEYTGTKENKAKYAEVFSGKDELGRGVNIERFVKLLPVEYRDIWGETLARVEGLLTGIGPQQSVNKAMKEHMGDRFQQDLKDPSKRPENYQGPLGKYSQSIKSPGRRSISAFHRK